MNEVRFLVILTAQRSERKPRFMGWGCDISFTYIHVIVNALFCKEIVNYDITIVCNSVSFIFAIVDIPMFLIFMFIVISFIMQFVN